MPWIVKLTKQPDSNHYKNGYFPRKFFYKRDAKELMEAVKKRGGDAVLERETRVKKEKR